MTTFLGERLFIRFTVSVFDDRSSICVCKSFSFGFQAGVWDLYKFLIIAFVYFRSDNHVRSVLFTYLFQK